MNIDFNNNIPIYIQLLDYLKTYIISSKIKCGEKLPSVRELALIFKVNPNTMQKALLELENIGLIYTERTNGKYVTSDKKVIENTRIEYANNIKNKYINDMNKIGFSDSEAILYMNRKENDND